MTATAEMEPVAKGKAGRPKTSQRNDVVVRVDSGIVAKAKMVAAASGVTLAEYVSELLRGPVDRDFAREMRKLEGGER